MLRFLSEGSLSKGLLVLSNQCGFADLYQGCGDGHQALLQEELPQLVRVILGSSLLPGFQNGFGRLLILQKHEQLRSDSWKHLEIITVKLGRVMKCSVVSLTMLTLHQLLSQPHATCNTASAM